MLREGREREREGELKRGRRDWVGGGGESEEEKSEFNVFMV